MYVAFGKKVFDFIDKTKLFFHNLWLDIIQLGLFLITLKGILILLAIFSPLLIYLNYWLNNTIADRLQEKRDEKKRLHYQERDIKELLKTDLEKLDVHKLWRFIQKLEDELYDIENTKFVKYEPQLLKKSEDAERIHEVKKHESRIKGLQLEEKKYEEALEYLGDQIYKRSRDEKMKKRKIYSKLYQENTRVFYKEELKDEEVEVLKENGYEQVNEYDIFSKNQRTFLIKSPLNHSATHTFLVWSIKKLLEDTKDVDKVEEHITRDADITFRYKKRIYAFEIETGDLLSKKPQLQQKITSLNRKYGNRWMFLVSNRDLLPDYRKWGKATQRREVEEVLEKWLE